MKDAPVISCLMVALPAASRLERLKRSVADYARQTWANRELVIVLNGGEPACAAAIRAHVATLRRDDIRVVEPAGDLPLGALRNISRAEAAGDLICQWDDDDLYHPKRLARQAQALLGVAAEAVCLEQVMQFFPAEGALYCDNFRGGREGCFPGSILAWRAAPITYPEAGEFARLGEDTAIVLEMRERGGLKTLGDQPHLYVYVSHGANSWDEAHHRAVPHWHAQSAALVRRREAQLREGLAPFAFGPGPITVHGRNEPAFTLVEATGA